MRLVTFHSFSPEGGIGDEILEKMSASSRACFWMSNEVLGGGLSFLWIMYTISFPWFRPAWLVRFISHRPWVGGDETFVAVVIHVSLFSASVTGSIGPDWSCHGMRSGGISMILVHTTCGEGAFGVLFFSPGRDSIINMPE